MNTIINLDEEIKAYFEELGTPANEIKKASPLEWLGCLRSIGKMFFSGDALRIKCIDTKNIVINKRLIDVYKLYLLCEEYIDLSCKYNKIINYKDFSDLARVDSTVIYNYKNIQVFKDYNIIDLFDNYNSNYNNYIDLINQYNNLYSDNNNTIIDKDIQLSIIYNKYIELYNIIYNSELLNVVKKTMYNNLYNKQSQTLWKKAEGTNQGFSFALMVNNNPDYQQETGSQQNSVISIDSLQNRLQIAQNKGLDNN